MFSSSIKKLDNKSPRCWINAHRKHTQCREHWPLQFSPNKYLAFTNHILMLAQNCGSSLTNHGGRVIGQAHSNMHQRYTGIESMVVVCEYSNHEMLSCGSNS